MPFYVTCVILEAKRNGDVSKAIEDHHQMSLKRLISLLEDELINTEDS